MSSRGPPPYRITCLSPGSFQACRPERPAARRGVPSTTATEVRSLTFPPQAGSRAKGEWGTSTQLEPFCPGDIDDALLGSFAVGAGAGVAARVAATTEVMNAEGWRLYERPFRPFIPYEERSAGLKYGGAALVIGGSSLAASGRIHRMRSRTSRSPARRAVSRLANGSVSDIRSPPTGLAARAPRSVCVADWTRRSSRGAATQRGVSALWLMPGPGMQPCRNRAMGRRAATSSES